MAEALDPAGPPFRLTDLFDRAGRLKPFHELPESITTQIASFDVVRTRIQRKRDSIVTEELIRVKLRDRRTATVRRRGPTTVSAHEVVLQPTKPPRVVTVQAKRAPRAQRGKAPNRV